MDKYANFVFKYNKEMPEPIQDILRIYNLYNKYEQLGEFTRAYPFLTQGEEPAYLFNPEYDGELDIDFSDEEYNKELAQKFSPEFTDENQKNFHWRIITEHDMDKFAAKMSDDDDTRYYLQRGLCKFVKRYPIYLNSDFCKDIDNSTFFKFMCKKACEDFWNGLKS